MNRFLPFAASFFWLAHKVSSYSHPCVCLSVIISFLMDTSELGLRHHPDDPISFLQLEVKFLVPGVRT